MDKIIAIMIIVAVGLLAVLGLLNMIFFDEYKVSESKTKLNFCSENKKLLNCEQLQDCYDECDNEGIINWIQLCRGEYLPYIIAKCKEVKLW